MAYLLTCKIKIGDVTLTSAHSVEITSSWRNLGDTCIINLPTRGVMKNGDTREAVSLSDVFKTGMPVEVQLGYDGNNKVEFQGYIAQIKPRMPLQLLCEDEVYQLKRSKEISKSYKKTKLSTLLNDLLPGVKLQEIPNVDIENFVIERATAAKVLQELKEKYLLSAYYKNKQLYVGPAFLKSSDQAAKFHFQKNIVTEDLTYKTEEDVKLKIKARIFTSNNKKVDFEAGDAEGEVRTWHHLHKGLYKDTEAERKALISQYKPLAEKQLQQYKFAGYRGEFTGFGLPYVEHSQVIDIQDDRYTERRGRYLVDEVRVSWGVSGFRRHIKPGIKLS
jgi:hypothetical protein